MTRTVAVAAAVAAAFSSAPAGAQSPVDAATVETQRAKGSTGPTFPGPSAEPLIATAPAPTESAIYPDGQALPADVRTISAPARIPLPPPASSR